MKNEALRKWIRQQPCAICNRWDQWLQNLGEGRSQVSHVRTYKATGLDDDNVLPMCAHCHQDHEHRSTTEKEGLLSLARDYTQKWRIKWKKA